MGILPHAKAVPNRFFGSFSLCRSD